MSFHPATRTRLYRSLKKQVLDSPSKNRWPEIGKNLMLLKNIGHDVNWNSEDLAEAFVWRGSPQGFEYWCTIKSEINPGDVW